MTNGKADLLIVGPPKPRIVAGLEPLFTVHHLPRATADASVAPGVAERIQAIAVTSSKPVDAAFMRRFPALKIMANLGVGYEHIDAAWAAAHQIVITHTPDVLNEEVADTALGLLLCTVRQLPQAMSYLQSGAWLQAPYPLSTATLRDRTVGMVGMGRIGQAIARRLVAFGVPVVYHSRRPNATVDYPYYPQLMEMAAEVDTLLCILPGGAATRNLIDARVLQALGARGILINVGRGSVVDEAALIDALNRKTIQAAGLDVFADEPHVPAGLIKRDNVVLFPHIGSASVYTRTAMEQLVVDNLLSWISGNGPLTPVPESK